MVEEIPIPVPRKNDGKYTVLRIRLRDWDTNRFVIKLSRDLHISNRRITYCGTKDKRAVTTQYFCINSDFDPARIRLGGADVLEVFRTDRMLSLGDLMGNRFTVNLHLDSDALAALEETAAQINERGGFPNYFGLQRFGSIRTNTHIVGRLMVQGRDEEAAMEYICDPSLDTDAFRIEFYNTQDPRAALRDFPDHLNFERSLLGYMVKHGTLKGSFSVFPKNLRMIFVHAYQSYLYNLIISRRMEQIGLNEVSDGDILVEVDGYFNQSGGRMITANSLNKGMLQELVNHNRLRPTAPLIGFDSRPTGGIQGEIEKAILEDEGITANMFRLRSYPDLSSSGERRITSALPSDFTVLENLALSFILGRGTYATSLIREFLKEKMNY